VSRTAPRVARTSIWVRVDHPGNLHRQHRTGQGRDHGGGAGVAVAHGSSTDEAVRRGGADRSVNAQLDWGSMVVPDMSTNEGLSDSGKLTTVVGGFLR